MQGNITHEVLVAYRGIASWSPVRITSADSFPAKRFYIRMTRLYLLP